ncbi:MAG: ribonuclease III [Endomicrobia bacterium]|nr:ribonuclease III [Endomicrobiia bacterium]MDW8055430.1 ribonuclease III [Elusimicrobiota bacterium]
MTNLEEIEKLLGIKFNNTELLRIALTHKSWAVENKISDHNERLEFLGDSVLAVVVAEYLYKKFPYKDEGSLSKLRSVLVSKSQLAKWGKQIGLGRFVLISKAEEITGGRRKDSIIAGVFEAILGAIYLDKGIEACKKFLTEKFFILLSDVEIQDYKSLLQEIAQKKFKTLPEYVIVKEVGPDHDKEFDCIVRIGERLLGHGKGKTKKQAQQNAAKEAIEVLKKLSLHS